MTERSDCWEQRGERRQLAVCLESRRSLACKGNGEPRHVERTSLATDLIAVQRVDERLSSLHHPLIFWRSVGHGVSAGAFLLRGRDSGAP